MNKCIGLVLTFVILISTVVGCQQNEYRKTITTNYGDELEIYVYLSGNLHGTYFTCEIRSEEAEGYAYFHDKNITNIPTDIAENLYTVVKNNDTKVYELYDEFIVISDGIIDNFSSNYDLEGFIQEKDVGMSIHTKYKGIEVLCNTKKFEYIKQFADILIYVNPNADISFINAWASGIFTDEEIELNKEFSKKEITDWSVDFIRQNT